MTTVAPVNQRASVPATFTDGMDFDGPVPAGVFEFYTDSDGPDAGILFGCPCGCGEMKTVGFRTIKRPQWTWNGDREKPTLTPSINILQMDATGKHIGEHWHGWLTDGEFRSC